MLRLGSKVKIQEHDIDRYGRTVAEVFKQNGKKNIGLMMVRKGYAEIYEKYAFQCDGDKLIKFQNIARKKRKGLWNDLDDTPFEVDDVDVPLLPEPPQAVNEIQDPIIVIQVPSGTTEVMPVANSQEIISDPQLVIEDELDDVNNQQ